MADQLYLSYRLNGYTAGNMIRHFERVLRVFPFSKLTQAGAAIRVNAVSPTEPALFEASYGGDDTIDTILEDMKEFQAADCASTLEAYWDLFQLADGEWKLQPTRVSLISFGPQFESGLEDHIRIELGIDAQFLPQAGDPESARTAESNVRSLLKLVHDLDDKLSVDSRRLWTESGENFAQRLQTVLQDEKPGPRLVK